jgi:hypothetical protein
MDFAFAFSGGSPVSKKFQIGETMANAGVPVVIGGAGNEGLALPTTTAAADLVGLTENAATLLTAQQTGNVDPAAYVSAIINPDAVYKARLSGGATTGTDLTTYTVTTASTTGLDVVTGDDFSNFDEGTIHCISGNNLGISRKITVGDATDASVTVAFPFDIAVGDKFIVVPYTPGENQFVQLTSDFLELDASAAVDTDNNNFRVLDLILNGVSDSYALIVPFDHLFAAGGSI